MGFCSSATSVESLADIAREGHTNSLSGIDAATTTGHRTSTRESLQMN